MRFLAAARRLAPLVALLATAASHAARAEDVPSVAPPVAAAPPIAAPPADVAPPVAVPAAPPVAATPAPLR